jgi:hypothetical protein
MGIINFIFLAIIIYVCYLLWDFFANGGWKHWIPGYDWVNSWFGESRYVYYDENLYAD